MKEKDAKINLLKIPKIEQDINDNQLKIGILSNLPTTDKTSIVNSIIETNEQLSEKANQSDLNTTNLTLTQKVDITTFNTSIANISKGTPLFADNIAGMTDTTRVYVNKADGFIYAYATSWVSTGVKYVTSPLDDKVKNFDLDFSLSPQNYGKSKFYYIALEQGGFSGADGSLWITTQRARSSAYINFPTDKYMKFINRKPSVYKYRLLRYTNNTGTYNQLAFDYQTTDYSYRLFHDKYYRIEVSRIDNGNVDVNDVYNSLYFVVEGIDDKRPFKPSFFLSVNHQGYNLVAPNETLSAYKKSVLHGFNAVECDIQWTSDNIPVLCHNTTVYANSSGQVNPTYNAPSGAYTTAYNINQTPYATLSTLDFGSWMSSEYVGEKMLKFEDLITFCKANGTIIVADDIFLAQWDSNMDNFKTLIDLANKYGMQDHIYWCVGSNTLFANHLVDLYRKAKIIFDPATYDQSFVDTIATLLRGENEILYEVQAPNLTSDQIAYVRNKGLKVGVFTVDDEATYDQYLYTCDAITSNRIAMCDRTDYKIV